MDPRHSLKKLVERGIDIDVAPQSDLDERPTRRSAVLILFGALDQIPAQTGTRLDCDDDPVTSSITSRVGAELDVLLLRRANGMRHHPGQIAFPGGGVDPTDASHAAAALREAQEETGLDPAGVEVIGTLPEIPIVVSNNLVTPVIGWWTRPSEVAAVDHTEAVQVFRVPVADLLNPAWRGVSVLRRQPRVYRSEAFRLNERLGGHTVWGFTGMVLSRLFDELDWSIPWDASQEFEIHAK